ncbi:MAG: hypothetical protein RLZZ500_1590 [Bacteroidota bacterium]|jgi:glycosyltransferase EpsH
MESITLIVACYNVEAFLEECLQSIAVQSYPHFKVLVIDDGATDATPSIIDQFAKNDSRFHAIHQSNKGLSETRNVGLTQVTTPWVAFIDGDDFLAPDYLQKLIAVAEGSDLVACSYNRQFKTNSLPRSLGWNGNYSAAQMQRRIIGLVDEELRDPSQADSMVTAWGKLYQTAIIQQHQLQFVSTKIIGTEDALFNIQYLEQANNVYILDEPLYQYRKYNAQSLTNTYKARLSEQWLHLYGLIQPYTLSKNEEFEQAYYNRVALSVIGLGLNEQLNPNGFWAKYSKLKAIMQQPLYEKAFTLLNLSYFPIHWKLFFRLAKGKWIIGMLFMLQGIQWMIKKNQ